MWSAAVDGKYSVSSGYQWLLGEQRSCHYAPVIWNRCVLPKHSFILWLVLLRRLLTLDRLASWLVVDIDETCVLCGQEWETLSHLFFMCSFSRRLVLEVAVWLGIDDCPVTHRRWRAWLGHCGRGLSLRAGVWSAMMAAAVYSLWLERNRRRHGQPACAVEELMHRLKDEFKCRLPLRAHGDDGYIRQLLVG